MSPTSTKHRISVKLLPHELCYLVDILAKMKVEYSIQQVDDPPYVSEDVGRICMDADTAEPAASTHADLGLDALERVLAHESTLLSQLSAAETQAVSESIYRTGRGLLKMAAALGLPVEEPYLLVAYQRGCYAKPGDLIRLAFIHRREILADPSISDKILKAQATFGAVGPMNTASERDDACAKAFEQLSHVLHQSAQRVW